MKHKILLFSLATTAVLSSCNDLLTQEPRNTTYGTAFWNDPKAGQSALAGNYAMLRNTLSTGHYESNNRYYMYGDAAASVEFVMRQSTANGTNDLINNGNYIHNYNVTSLGDWTGYYKVIAMSNTILKEMAKVPDNVLLKEYDNPEEFRRGIMGQAYFIRGLTYFFLTRVWGDVPLVTEAYDDPINAPHLGKSSKLEVMAQVEADCHEAINRLRWGYENQSDKAVMANRGSAYALLAHLFLWRATMSDVSNDNPIMADVNSADTTIATLKARGGYTLSDTLSYSQVFIGRSNESIFELSAEESDQEGSTYHIGRYFLNRTYANNLGTNAFFYVRPAYLDNYFYNNVTSEDWVWNATLGVWEWKEIITKSRDVRDFRYRNLFQFTTSQFPVCVKYSNVTYRDPTNMTGVYYSNNWNIFRLSDIELLRAEIAIYQGNLPEAVSVINTSRKRYNPNAFQIGAGLTKAEVTTAYIEERFREMYLEGHLFYDLLRTRKATQVIGWMSENRFRGEGFYWPVNPRLFSDNRHLTQTEYWRGQI